MWGSLSTKNTSSSAFEYLESIFPLKLDLDIQKDFFGFWANQTKWSF